MNRKLLCSFVCYMIASGLYAQSCGFDKWAACANRTYPIAPQIDVIYREPTNDYSEGLFFNDIKKRFSSAIRLKYLFTNVEAAIKSNPSGIKNKEMMGPGYNTIKREPAGLNIALQNFSYIIKDPRKLAAYSNNLNEQQLLRNVLQQKNDLNLRWGFQFRRCALLRRKGIR